MASLSCCYPETTENYLYPTDTTIDATYEFYERVTDSSGLFIDYGPYYLIAGCVPEAANVINVVFSTATTNPPAI